MDDIIEKFDAQKFSNSKLYVLSLMVCDKLAMPISILASKLAFNIGWWTLD